MASNPSITYASTGGTWARFSLPDADVYQELKNVCVWIKDNTGMGSFYRSQHELVFVFKRGRRSHRNNVRLGQFGRNRTNV